MYRVSTDYIICTAYNFYQTSISYHPPFIYNYGCSSAVITSFIPVFIYSHVLSAIISLTFQINCFYKILRKENVCVFKLFRLFLPPIVWDLAHASDETAEVINQTTEENKVVPRKLFSAQFMYATYFETLLMLIIFGLSSPFLSFTIMVLRSSTIFIIIIINFYFNLDFDLYPNFSMLFLCRSVCILRFSLRRRWQSIWA
jgi:hypothetical protein